MKREDCKIGMRVTVTKKIVGVVASMNSMLALVYLGKSYAGHNGGHCSWFYYDELTPVKQQAKQKDKKEIELKPCPFCGSEDWYIGELLVVECANCKAKGPEAEGDEPITKSQAVRLWNKRTKGINQ